MTEELEAVGIDAVRYPTNSPQTFKRVKELKALAAELGAKFAPTNAPGLYVVVVNA